MTASDHDFTQLTGAFDAPVTPAPSFTEHLRARLGAMPEAAVPTPLEAPQATTPASEPFRMNLGIDPERPTRHRGVRTWMTVAASLAALVLLGAMFFRLIDSAVGPRQPVVTFAAAPLAGTPGASNATFAQLPGLPPMTIFNRVIGDVAYGQVWTSSVDAHLIAYDLANKQVLWENESTDDTYLVPAGDRLLSLGFSISRADPPAETTTLQALDASTGTTLWTTTVQTPDDGVYQDEAGTVTSPVAGTQTAYVAPQMDGAPAAWAIGAGPVVVGNSVYLASTDGDVLGWDVATGSQVFTSRAPVDVMSSYRIVDLRANGHRLFFAISDQLLSLDPKSDTAWTPLPKPEGTAPNFINNLQLRDGLLISSAIDSNGTETLYAIDLADDKLAWSTPAAHIGSFVESDGDYLIHYSTNTETLPWPLNQIPMLNRGRTTQYVDIIDPQTGGSVIEMELPFHEAEYPMLAMDDRVCYLAEGITCLTPDGRSDTVNTELLPENPDQSVSSLLGWNGHVLININGEVWMTDQMP